MSPSLSDIKLARRGDKEAFARLIRTLELSLYGVARSMLRRDEDCADAIQETILKAWNALPSLKEPAYFKTWLCRILINECRRLMRRDSRTVAVDEIPAEAFSTDAYENIDLRKAVDRLEETLRLVVTLHYYEDMPLKEIAELLEAPEGTIKSRLHRARQLLAEWLEGPEERKMTYEPC
ncbi:sigma-70 family RNA polymerase sigma factor [Paenibacillus aurantius]|uniref:Sigma-70 family RNA polymerase sigma factor n=1 Tax=Paenibacillus aurantius TaxID=2918900 RepID=A0AA96RF98_9BACL|nr:sigma-70 family RNA polymerase sigma factor [Paenibacillus aurantius]WJH35940.1 sigma-70 family RNA polymerase sigma factor [Paenibacillus sp. CC-CFT747]WNQ11231.1 sigma-70 family RNA polymerase sigma factor [Paenibacillus aurantius]